MRAHPKDDRKHRHSAKPYPKLRHICRRSPSGAEVTVVFLAAVRYTRGEGAAAEVCVFDFVRVAGTGDGDGLAFAAFREAVADADAAVEDVDALYDEPVGVG